MLCNNNELLEYNENKTFYICINSYENRIPSGIVYDGSADTGKKFNGTMYMLDLINQITNSFSDEKIHLRSFGEESNTVWENGPHTDGRTNGALATFKLNVIFRQGNDWQGEIHWLDKDKTECFRSGIELLRLIDSALQ